MKPIRRNQTYSCSIRSNKSPMLFSYRNNIHDLRIPVYRLCPMEIHDANYVLFNCKKYIQVTRLIVYRKTQYMWLASVPAETVEWAGLGNGQYAAQCTPRYRTVHHATVLCNCSKHATLIIPEKHRFV